MAQVSKDSTESLSRAIYDKATLNGILSAKYKAISGGADHRRLFAATKLTWNLLRVIFHGHRLADVEDLSLTGFGKVGLWLKADSVKCLDSFEIVTTK